MRLRSGLEGFFNRQSDWDWTWGPLRHLRPPRQESMRPWLWVRLFLAMTLLGLLSLALLVAADVYGIRWLTTRHVPPPPALAEAQTTLAAMAADRSTQALLIGLLFCLPPLFFTFCLPYHWAWNCRAARLRQEKPDVEEKRLLPGVWPPPVERRT